jgi:hypothetical protein
MEQFGSREAYHVSGKARINIKMLRFVRCYSFIVITIFFNYVGNKKKWG